MTWSEAILYAEQQLDEGAIHEARLTAELLAAHVLKVWNRSEVRTLLIRVITDEELASFKTLVDRRLAGEPLQYIIGEAEFFGLRIFTTPAALIPRPETELLVEEVLRELRLRGYVAPRILDIGTGSGAIALAIAANLHDAQILGVDASVDAVRLAEQNRVLLKLANVQFEVCDIFSDSNALGIFDVVLSNPPYIPVSEIADLDRELRDREPRMALTDESDGLSFYRRIAEIVDEIMHPAGILALEMGFGASNAVREIMQSHNINCLRVVDDLGGIPRVFIGERTPQVKV